MLASKGEVEADPSRTKPMVLMDGAIYNFLTMGPMFPWAYLSGLAAFPGASVPLALLLAFAIEIPLCLAYSFLSSRMRGNGGDYLYQSDAFGAFGGAIVLSGFVIWPLQWVATLGWLFATVGIGPICYILGFYSGKTQLILLGAMAQSPGGVVITTVLVILAALWILNGGLRRFIRIQQVLFTLALCALIAECVVFGRSVQTVSLHFDVFTRAIATRLPGTRLPETSVSSLRHLLLFDTSHHFYQLNTRLSWLGTLAIVPIAWTSLQWATFSVEQNEEINTSRSMAHQLLMTLVPAAGVTVVMIAVALLETRAFGGAHQGTIMLRALAAAQDPARSFASPSLSRFMSEVLPPFPSVLAMASSGNAALAILIGVGLLANAFQVLSSCFVGAAFIMKTMASRHDLPRREYFLRLESVRTRDCRLCRGKRVRDHTHFGLYTIYAGCAVPVVLGYNLVPHWGTYTLGLTFGCGYVFMLTSLAAFIWARRASNASELRSSNNWAGRVGLLSFALVVLLLGECLLISRLELNGSIPLFYVGAVLVISLIIVKLSRRASPAEVDSQNRTITASL